MSRSTGAVFSFSPTAVTRGRLGAELKGCRHEGQCDELCSTPPDFDKISRSNDSGILRSAPFAARKPNGSKRPEI